MAAYEVLLLNTAIPQIQAAQSGDTYVVPRDIAINATAIISANSATDALRITQTGAGNAILVEDSANPDSTPFVVTAAGNVGIGTDSPAARLHIVSTSADAAIVASNQVSTFQYFVSSGTTQGPFVGGNSDDLLFGTTGSARMRLDSSGNLGLGVTPSAWANHYAFDIGPAGSVAAYQYTDNLTLDLTVNGYAIGLSTYRYKRDGVASRYFQQSGQHNWQTAPSGTANSTTIVSGNQYTIVTAGGNFTAFGAANNNVGTVFTATSSGTASGGAATQSIVFTQAMTLDASGNLVVGATSTSSRFEAVAGTGAQLISTFRTGDATAANNAGGGFYGISSATAATREATLWLDADGANFAGGDYFYIQKFGNSGVVNIVQYSNAAMTFYTSAQEKARITSGGYFKASNNGTYAGSTGSYHELRSSANELTVAITNTNAILSSELIYLDTAIAAGTGFFFMRAYANSVQQFQIRGDGNVYNANGTYGTLSDQKLKQDIVDAGSQWADIKAIRFRKYRMKSDVAANPDAPAMLGVIAQELEQVSPGLVDEYPDMETVEVTDEDGNVTQTQQPTGTTTKTVKSSILLMKAAVALQEAMARIEKLEAEVAALKGA